MALRYRPEGRGFDSRWCHWNFSLKQFFRPHFGPGVDSASNRNVYHEYFLGGKGGRCVGPQCLYKGALCLYFSTHCPWIVPHSICCTLYRTFLQSEFFWTHRSLSATVAQPKRCPFGVNNTINTVRTGEADLRFYITNVQDGWRKSAFLTGACFPCTIHLIMQYIEPVSEWSCWRIFIETWPHSELTFRHRASSI